MSHLSDHVRTIILEMLDEERITNKAASLEVQARKNFIGSHTYGEDIGDLGKMYVAYSYGEQHPLYVWVGEEDAWYYNYDEYILRDGTPNIWTRKHLKDLRPNSEVQGRPGSTLKKKIEDFKQKHNIPDSDNGHTDLQPGEK
jgi:hypothetical protein